MWKYLHTFSVIWVLKKLESYRRILQEDCVSPSQVYQDQVGVNRIWLFFLRYNFLTDFVSLREIADTQNWLNPLYIVAFKSRKIYFRLLPIPHNNWSQPDVLLFCDSSKLHFRIISSNCQKSIFEKPYKVYIWENYQSLFPKDLLRINNNS